MAAVVRWLWIPYAQSEFESLLRALYKMHTRVSELPGGTDVWTGEFSWRCGSHMLLLVAARGQLRKRKQATGMPGKHLNVLTHSLSLNPSFRH